MTTPEQRHAWIIAVAPEVDAGKTDPTDAQKAAAKKIADQALADDQDRRQEVGGRREGRLDRRDEGERRRPRLDRQGRGRGSQLAGRRCSSSTPNGLTDVILGDDGDLPDRPGHRDRPGRGRRGLDQKLDRRRASARSTYRAAIRSEVLRQALDDKAVADAMRVRQAAPGPRALHQAPRTPPLAKAIKVRHILFSPNDDPEQGPATCRPNDPAWTRGPAGREGGVRRPVKDPSKFDSIARDKSDEAAAQGDDGHRRQAAVLRQQHDSFVQEFEDAVLKPGLKPGDILAPFKTDFGWHVVQIMYRPPDSDEMNELQDPGRRRRTDFADARPRLLRRPRRPARAATRAGSRTGQLDDRLTAAIYAAPVGGLSARSSTSRTAACSSTRSLEERTQTPDADQLDDDQGERLPELVRREEGRGDDHPRRSLTELRGSADPAAVLDALVAEARLRWGLDLAAGLQVVAAERLIATPLEPSRPALIVPARGAPRRRRANAANAAGREPLPGRHGPGGARPGRAPPPALSGGPSGRAVRGRRGLDGRRAGSRRPRRAALPAAGRPRGRPSRAPGRCPGSRDRLRLPDGCPWDREQTHESLRNHLLEEAYEVYDALGGGATPALAEELGDLLLQVVLHAQLAAEEGVFDLTDVNAAIAVEDRPPPPPRVRRRRGPHRVGREPPVGADQGRRAGGAAAARAKAPTATARPKGALDGVSRILPALAASQEMQERAANIGYEWPNVEGVLDKVVEETRRAARRRDRRPSRPRSTATCCSSSSTSRRWQGIEAEAALRAANDKFRRRFASVERQAAERGVALRDLIFDGARRALGPPRPKNGRSEKETAR